MFDFNSSVFQQLAIPETAQIIFVADMFVSDYVGGAELTSQALIDSSPFEVFKLKSSQVTLQLLEQGANRLWIFGNFSQLNPQLIPTIIGNLKYSILEYDYKYCKFRSPEKHLNDTLLPCDCHNQINGKMVSAFFYGAQGLWWMSEKQKERYHTFFPFLAEKDNIVLSSVFDDKTLGLIKLLRQQSSNPRKGWIVLGSNSWVKGAQTAEKWCVDNGKDSEIVWNLPYEKLLEKLASAEGFVYLPAGGDTCPRMVIEAKLLGCQLHLNDNVQHKDEDWFKTDSIQEIEGYLYAARKLFWNGIKKMMEYKPTISGYTTTYNCISQSYPFDQCIKSMLSFCDEVCVVDGGSQDGTWEELQKLANDDPKLVLKQVVRDWNHPRFAVFDGMQKAEARNMCQYEFCIQLDADEVIHTDDGLKFVELCRTMPRDLMMIALPVIEYWGSKEKCRIDVTPWKWRVSRNHPDITHGIPKEMRRYDEKGEMFATMGTDGCDMVTKSSGDRVPFATFYSQDADSLRHRALTGDTEALSQYETWFNSVVNNIPSVFHFSWIDIARKIKLYRGYWQTHWLSLYNQAIADTAENNMFFNVPWSEVDDAMIEHRAEELATIGGWVFHQKWNGTKTPWISVRRSLP